MAAALDDLDEDQRLAVTTSSRLVAVIAGAGSGKTRVLTRRIAFRVHEGTADARHTLVLTFTREAAGELRRRLPRLGLRERVDAGTFHSVVLGLLRQHHADRGRAMPTVVQDRRRLLAAALDRHRGLDELVAELEWASARGIDAAAYANAARRHGRRTTAPTEQVVRALSAYADEKRRRGVVDLDDLLSMTAGLLERDPVFADAVAWRYRHVLVDEAQDLNPVQHRLVDLLRRGHDDLYLVGDPAQAVYGFNGADPALLVDVAERFPGVEVVRLRTNHRCTPQVVHTGSHVLLAGKMEPTAERSGLDDGPGVEVRPCEDEAHEARTVAALVANVDPGLIRHREVAVLARTHAQLVALTAALADAGVAVVRRLDGPGSPYRAALADASRQRSAPALRAWAHDLLDDLGADDRPTPTGEQVEVAHAVLDYLRDHPLGDGIGLRSWIASTDPFGTATGGGVELATFHGAKGREWDTVIVTGVETGLVPHRSASTNEARAEEARLLYVAVTRARRRLVVTWSERRGGYRRKRSPLLDGFEPLEHAAVAPPAHVLLAADSSRRDGADGDGLRDGLRTWRRRTARNTGLLPEQVCDDATLVAIERARPRDESGLAAVPGVGPITARRWFPQLAPVLDPTAQSSRSTITGA